MLKCWKNKKDEARQEVLQCHSSYFAKRYKLETCVSRSPECPVAETQLKLGHAYTHSHTHIYIQHVISMGKLTCIKDGQQWLNLGVCVSRSHGLLSLSLSLSVGPSVSVLCSREGQSVHMVCAVIIRWMNVREHSLPSEVPVDCVKAWVCDRPDCSRIGSGDSTHN